DYDTLLQTLHAAGKWPERIVHLWNVSPAPEEPATQTIYAFYSLLYLAQALDKARSEETAELYIIANELHAITEAEPVAAEKRLLCGPAKVIPQEFDWLTTQIIDLQLPPAGSWLWGELTQLLLAEFGVPLAGPSGPTVAYRGRRRWVQEYTPAPLSLDTASVPRLRPYATALITGGLGG
ncbi:MAG: hypothetical protein KC449_30760, partial [Anaerolineales bacterium]|nr:hypothetical protein [Anaerolineales bacterium]